MLLANQWRRVSLKISTIGWSMAVLGTASAGFFLGMDQTAHSDLQKYSALLSLHDRMPGEVIVKVKPNGLQRMSAYGAAGVIDTSRFSVTEMSSFETNNSFYLVKLSDDAQTASFLGEMNKSDQVEYAEPNYIVKKLGERDNADENIPNDPDFAKLWGMKNSGQKDSGNQVGVANADIGAARAWTITTGNKDVIVAVIDTGVDYTHPDLVGNIYKNPGESGSGKETNGIDDDSNGFVDDFRGWNFAGVSNNNPMDDNEHGTHVAGTIGANGNDGRGVVGVNWNTSILPIKFLTGGGSGTLADAVKSIQYATIMGAHVMNNSWGGGGFTQSMFDSIVEAKNKGLLFVAAAGNDGDNADSSPHYPAGYQVDNVLAVAATDNRDALASFSTFGKRTVHIAAPGHRIVSSVPGGGYDSFSGTSMASPHAAGAAVLFWGANRGMTYLEVKERLMNSRDYLGGLSRKIISSGRLNVDNALRGVYPPSPEPAESDWRDFSISNAPESKHPYDNNARQEWTLEGPANAKFMRVVFSKLDLEEGYDYVKVIDASGAEMDSVSGKGENVSTFYVTGNKLTLRFTSDSSETRWGFQVGKLQVVY
jgi:thermitase